MKPRALMGLMILVLFGMMACDQILLTDIVYSVHFHANGADEETLTVTSDSDSFTIPANTFNRAGYSFSGWNTQADGSELNYSEGDNVILEDIEINFYAQWSLNATYNINFDANGGTGTMEDQSITEGITESLTINSFSYTGYSFLGWNTESNGSGTTYSDEVDFTMEGNNVTLYAQWSSKPTHTITFDPNGGTGTMADQSIVEEVTETLTTNSFTYGGNYFAGWNTEENGSGTSYDDEAIYTMGSGNETLYAQWSVNTSYTITFDANGGIGNMSNQSIIEGTTEGLTTNSYTRTGYAFNGWATNEIDDGTEYTDEADFIMGSSDVTLYAQWVENSSYTISYDANGGAGSMLAQSIVEDLTASLTDNGFSLTGYYFAGWNTASDGDGTSYSDGEDYTMGNSDVTLYAQWSLNPSYTISFDANGGTGSMSSLSVVEGMTEDLTNNVFSLTGYFFSQWNNESDGSGTSYSDGAGYTMGSSYVTLYAQWTINDSYTITFNANGGTGTMDDQSIVEEMTEALAANSFTYSGYTFEGWNTESDGSGTSYNDESDYTMGGSDETLYAQWTLNPSYSISFDVNGGSGSMSDQSIVEGMTETLTSNTFTLTGFYLSAWNTESNGSGISYSDGSDYTMGSSDTTLYAQWNQNPSYTITFDANGGTGTMDELSIVEELSSELSSNGFTFDHCTFNSWNTEADGTGETYSEGESYTMGNSDMTLYAQWDKIYFTSVWNVEESTGYTLQIPFAVDGTYEFQVDWGDGNSETITSMDSWYIEHTYSSEGEYTVSIWGTAEGFGYPCPEDADGLHSGSLVDISDWGDVQFHDYGYQFSNSTVANFSATNEPDLSQISNVRNMFDSCELFNGDISGWDTSNIRNMNGMFNVAMSFNKDLSGWDTSNVEDMGDMFMDAESFNCGGIDISTWDWNIESLTVNSGMFEGSALEGSEPDWFVE